MIERIRTRVRFVFTLLCLILFSRSYSQNFYKEDIIQEIKIYFSYSNWDYRLDTAKAGKEDYILAEYCLVNGVRFDSVGVKYKGNSSYNTSQVKNPLHLKLDWVKDNQEYDTYNSIKLGNNFSDQSVVREVLSYKILKNYMDCSLANFAKVYINDKYIGLYSNVEAVNKKFCSDHFGSSDHVFVKGNPDRPGLSSTSNLVYINNDSSRYYSLYGMENNFGWSKLIALMDTLKNNSSRLPSIMDIDRAIWMHAFNSVFSNYDSYTGSFSQNYYLYEDDFGRMLPVVWDLNMSIGGFPGGSGGGATTVDKTSLFIGETNASRPLIQKILQDPRYKRMYTAHVRTFCNEFIANREYENIAKKLQTFVDSLVKTDPNSLTSYSAFQSSLTAPILSGGGPMGSRPGISTLMDARLAYFRTIAEFNATAPTITDIKWESAQIAIIGDTAWLNASVSNVNYAYCAFRKNRFDIFSKYQMYDDGLHHDGLAGDHVFGMYFIPTGNKTQYYIYAENNNAGIFSPERAEFEFHVLEAEYPYPRIGSGDVVINELMTSNQTAVLDSTDNKFEDWTELYNNTDQEVNLAGFYLSDDFANPQKWEFPASVVIGPKSRIVIWLDEDGNALNGLHANFKLSASGEELILSRPDGLLLDSISFGTIPTDYSYERCPDGLGAFAISKSFSYNSKNCPISSNEALFVDVKVFPNPAREFIHVELSSAGNYSIMLVDMTGRIIKRVNMEAQSEASIALDNIPAGMCILSLLQNDNQQKLYMQKVSLMGDE